MADPLCPNIGHNLIETYYWGYGRSSVKKIVLLYKDIETTSSVLYKSMKC